MVGSILLIYRIGGEWLCFELMILSGELWSVLYRVSFYLVDLTSLMIVDE